MSRIKTVVHLLWVENKYVSDSSKDPSRCSLHGSSVSFCGLRGAGSRYSESGTTNSSIFIVLMMTKL